MLAGTKPFVQDLRTALIFEESLKKKKIKFLCQINIKMLIAATEMFAVVNKRVAITTTMFYCCFLLK